MSPDAARVVAQRTSAIGRHMMSTTADAEPTVKFESNNSLRTFVLNRPSKLNALDQSMLTALRPKIEEWNTSELCGTIVGTGAGKGFCAGGDVAAVVQNAADKRTRPLALKFFKEEFELDYILAALEKPYVAILDGVTMGGGVGLSANAPFRVATEKTMWAMPETKIGYFPDVGASYFLSRMDGQLGTYLALTGETLTGRAVFEHGLATHYIPSRRIPLLLERLAELERPSLDVIDRTIEEMSCEPEANESQSVLTGGVRAALDAVFRHDTVEHIVNDLEALSEYEDTTIRNWADKTLNTLNQRSPTSLKVALQALRLGKDMDLAQAMEMELKVAGAYCYGAAGDFPVGVQAVLVDKVKSVPDWEPASLKGVALKDISRFFGECHYTKPMPGFQIPEGFSPVPKNQHLKYALPTESEIGAVVIGTHAGASGMGTTLEEVQNFFEKSRPGKHGVKEKVKEVVERRCTITDNADGNFVWLKWIH
ncbi:3-hydroxyisobutyryl-coenzyme A hydrolase isoform 1 [Coprinopsis marcescibilis]|uniref:3-hydroxyisobutyryl-CoA hydrolase n=1 Tax=Coprinopsis marcescibilis TaxID=230819 RepID=A0A5C3LAK0_COPMA|nr:3-hydroxyisobutyryl-coenzyme A hydrolase isoform 1 [Coprinopsis marcescibilis]